MGRTTKTGDLYLHMLLVPGDRALLTTAKSRTDPVRPQAEQMAAHVGRWKAALHEPLLLAGPVDA